MAIPSFLLAFSLFFFILPANSKGLSLNFYQETCPSLEYIVHQQTTQIISNAPSLAPSLLRLHFHDCFVRGCDASILLNSTAHNTAEKDSIPNLSLRGFQQIDIVKSAVEKQCPGVVSCADILALVARDAIFQINGPFWQVPLGRRDGNVSSASEALANLPPPFSNISQLISSFNSKGLTILDLVVLSGAHTIGISHCSSFSSRIYNFSAANSIDPTLNLPYAKTLQNECPPADLATNIVAMDPISPGTFDVDYYELVRQNRGLFRSDAALLKNPITNSYVQTHSNSCGNPSFFADFAGSMVKMGNIQVLTGKQGQIRKMCSAIN